jgi:hypothetical protein
VARPGGRWGVSLCTCDVSMPRGFNDVDIDRPDDLLSAARQPCCAVQAAVTCVCGQVRGGWHGISVCTCGASLYSAGQQSSFQSEWCVCSRWRCACNLASQRLSRCCCVEQAWARLANSKLEEHNITVTDTRLHVTQHVLLFVQGSVSLL